MLLIESRPEGLYCPVGDFYIDPLKPVSKAVITHAHADHFCSGCNEYIAQRTTISFLKLRMGRIAPMKALDYGQVIDFSGVKVSLHSAGHMPGSAQVRVEYKGEVWVITGDYKPEGNPFCAPFELLKCDVLVTECTFSHPRFAWPEEDVVRDQIIGWYRNSVGLGKYPVLAAYAIGKAQKIMSMLREEDIPIMVHRTVDKFNKLYKDLGMDPGPYKVLKDGMQKKHFGNSLILVPPTVLKTAWMKRFKELSVGLCSGWLTDESAVSKRGADQGFILSDHADFNAILSYVELCGADLVYLMHGNKEEMSKFFVSKGIKHALMKYQ